MTPKQTALYWRTFSAACSVLGLSTTADREDYRHRVLREEARVTSIKQLDAGSGFDSVMARLSSDAGDFLAASNYATGDDRRLAAMVRDCAIQVLELSGDGAEPSAYLDGILRQSRLASSCVGADGDVLLDVSPGAMRRVFQMLDTHRRRLLRRAGITHDLAFRLGARKVVVSGVLVDAQPPLPEITVRCHAA